MVRTYTKAEQLDMKLDGIDALYFANMLRLEEIDFLMFLVKSQAPPKEYLKQKQAESAAMYKEILARFNVSNRHSLEVFLMKRGKDGL